MAAPAPMTPPELKRQLGLAQLPLGMSAGTLRGAIGTRAARPASAHKPPASSVQTSVPAVPAPQTPPLPRNVPSPRTPPRARFCGRKWQPEETQPPWRQGRCQPIQTSALTTIQDSARERHSFSVPECWTEKSLRRMDERLRKKLREGHCVNMDFYNSVKRALAPFGEQAHRAPPGADEGSPTDQ